MQKIRTPAGHTVSYVVEGDGQPLVLVHGAFSDHVSNWVHVWPLLTRTFRVYAIARRGRGETSATEGHSIPDEADDVVEIMKSIGEPVILLGHSYGAHCALQAAALAPELVSKLVLYEAPWPSLLAPHHLESLETYASTRDWDGLASYFFLNLVSVPPDDLALYRASPDWAGVIADTPATLHDMRSLARATFDPARFGALAVPTRLQIGSESPRDLYVTDALVAALPNAAIDVLEGHAHEGMTTGPALYAERVRAFALGS
jgi:pimeloyl-ACP methyl ester carboxylesterase